MAASKKTNQAWLWIIGIIWLLAALSLVFSVVAAFLSERNTDVANNGLWQQLTKVGYTLTVLFSLTGIGMSSVAILSCLSKVKTYSAVQADTISKLQGAQTQIQAVLTQISENILLSDAVKSIAFREKDHMVLREAIEQDLKQQRWDSAAALIESMAQRFGSGQEAQQLRAQLERERKTNIEEKIVAAIKHIEALWMIHHYEEAQHEVEVLQQLYPYSGKVQDLQGETEKRRQAHKQELLERWNKAVQENDFDQGVELLKLLDKYLTAAEAGDLQESARGVFKGKLQNMGVQFRLFVTEKKWTRALQLGKQIIEEFPKSRMAQEVQEILEVLEQRAKK